MTEEEKTQETNQEISQDKISVLMETLEKAGITEAEDPAKALEGKIAASRQAGNLANQLGNARTEIAQLTQALESAKAPRMTENNFDLDGYQQIDIEKVIEDKTTKAVLNALDQKEQQQMKINNQMLQTYNAITTDPDYAIVKDKWEGKLKDPNFSSRLSSGQLHPEKAYMETKIEAFKEVAKMSYDTINQLRGTPSADPRPALETSESRGTPQNLVGTNKDASPQFTEQKELLGKIEKGYVPDDDEIIDKFDDVLNAAFSNNSPR